MMTSLIAFISPGGSELLLIMLVLILLFGAKDAPRILRSLQTTLDRLQRAAASFRYKIMYGDVHQGTVDEVPYEVGAGCPDESEECIEFEAQSSGVKPEVLEKPPERSASEAESSESRPQS